MTKFSAQAFREASNLPEAKQDALAEAIQSEIMAEEDWEKSFAGSQDVLEHLADEAVSEHRAGRTQPITPRKR